MMTEGTEGQEASFSGPRGSLVGDAGRSFVTERGHAVQDENPKSADSSDYNASSPGSTVEFPLTNKCVPCIPSTVREEHEETSSSPSTPSGASSHSSSDNAVEIYGSSLDPVNAAQGTAKIQGKER